MLQATVVTALTAVLLFAPACSRDPFGRAPRLIVVVPDRAEDLRFLNSADVGVALLSGRISFSDRGAHLEPRQSAFYLPPGKPFLIGAFDVDFGKTKPPDPLVQDAARLIAAGAGEHFFAAVQINADLTSEQRGWLRDLFARLRPLLRNHQLLVAAVNGATCADRGWVQSVVADTVVPLAGVCGGTSRVTLSPDTRSDPVLMAPSRRIYLESPKPWTAAALEGIVTVINRR